MQLLARREMSLAISSVTLNHERDPLPGQGDLQVRDRVLSMEGASAPRLTSVVPGSIATERLARPGPTYSPSPISDARC